MQAMQRITHRDTNYPDRLKPYLRTETPLTLWARGDTGLLPGPHTRLNGELWAFFCSSKCPGEIILKAHDLAHTFKNEGVPTIGGFHSTVEQEFFRVLLLGTQPIIFCPARSIERFRLNREQRKALAEQRLLLLSMFEGEPRMSADLAARRNAMVAALADKICIGHAAPGSRTLAFAEQLIAWEKPVYTFDTSTNEALFQLGTRQINRLHEREHNTIVQLEVPRGREPRTRL